MHTVVALLDVYISFFFLFFDFIFSLGSKSIATGNLFILVSYKTGSGPEDPLLSFYFVIVLAGEVFPAGSSGCNR